MRPVYTVAPIRNIDAKYSRWPTGTKERCSSSEIEKKVIKSARKSSRLDVLIIVNTPELAFQIETRCLTRTNDRIQFHQATLGGAGGQAAPRYAAGATNR
jgi:hypothetical protein